MIAKGAAGCKIYLSHGVEHSRVGRGVLPVDDDGIIRVELAAKSSELFRGVQENLDLIEAVGCLFLGGLVLVERVERADGQFRSTIKKINNNKYK